jgi:glycosidase
MPKIKCPGLLLILVTGFWACNTASTDPPAGAGTYDPKPYVEIKHPEWTKNATIYEVNIRQFTPEGTFKAFESHLPKLKEMGVDILWLMPVHPIGEKNRKGTLGSYYAVKDYLGINPEFGSMEDFDALVKKIHDMGMYVILDWVGNHTATDNKLVTEHPEWYIKSRAGNFQPTPWRDYDDIIDFDYSQPGLRQYMTNALKFWVKDHDIDGYRCDIASFMPLDFWEQARKELDAIKPVFMLAEAADRDLHKRAFDMTYSWSLWDHLHGIATQGKSLKGLTEGYIAEHVSIWPRDGYRMNFIDNHDKNSWEGNQVKNFGDALHAAIVLTCTVEGMPMVYSGQEAGLARSLSFFEKDPIEWKKDTIGSLYASLFKLKHEHPALWNGSFGGEMDRIKNDKMEQVIAFAREKNNDKVITIVNYSPNPATVALETNFDKGEYRDWFSGEKQSLNGKDTMMLKPWEYKIIVK